MKHLILIVIFLFTIKVHGQMLTKVAVRIGTSFSDQIKSPILLNDSGIKVGVAATIEPTLITFGAKKQFDFNTDFSFIQKGGMNYSPILTSSGGRGSEIYPVTLNYFCLSPTIKATFAKIVFMKAGPRVDVLISYNTKDLFNSDKRTDKDFDKATFGVTYGVGICAGHNRVKFIAEFDAQYDFTDSSFNKMSGQTFRNYCGILNFGVSIGLRAEKE